jgi:hypothetical protein
LTDLFGPEGPVLHVEFDPAERRAPKIVEAKAFAAKSRAPCGACNNGWMNTLDLMVRPLLAAFVEPRSVTLSAEDQAVVSTWAWKVTLGHLSRYESREPIDPRRLYRELFTAQAPPLAAQIWLGAVAQRNHANFIGSRISLSAIDSQEQAFAFSQSFGRAVLHILWHGQTGLEYRLGPDLDDLLRPVWPASEAVDWPTPLCVDATRLEVLTDLIGMSPSGFVSTEAL